jgi:hypothetical protein
MASDSVKFDLAHDGITQSRTPAQDEHYGGKFESATGNFVAAAFFMYKSALFA